MGGGQGSATTPAMAKGKHTRTTDWFGELPRKHLRTTHAGGTLVRDLCDQWASEMDAGTDDVGTNLSPAIQPSQLPPLFLFSEKEDLSPA